MPLRREVMERYPGTREVYLRNGKPIAKVTCSSSRSWRRRWSAGRRWLR
jgi:hypothetical protein